MTKDKEILENIERLWEIQEAKADEAEKLLGECETIENEIKLSLKQLSEEFPEEFEKLIKSFEEEVEGKEK